MPVGARRFLSILTPPVVIGAAIIIALGAVGASFLMLRARPKISWSTVNRGSITEVVTASGSVAPTESIDMGFQRSGTIAQIAVGVGDHVAAGQTLASLTTADLSALREEAAANLEAAQAKLAQLQAGARPELLATDSQTVVDDMQAGFIAADDAVHNKLDQFFNSPRTSSPTIIFPMSDQQLQSKLLAERVAIEQALSDLRAQSAQGGASSSAALVAAAQSSVQDLGEVEQLLDTATQALSSAIPTSVTPSVTIAAYQTSVNTARTNVVGALSALTAATGALSLAEAGSTSEDIAAQEAAVAAAQAALDGAEANLMQALIVAPIAGVITRQDGNIGEVVAAGVPFISLNSDARFELKAYVSEADIGKINLGDAALVGLDAYPGVPFNAAVVSIDPAATVQNGVPSYLVTLQFKDLDPRIKAGLTGNLSITAGGASDALLIPATALITNGSETYVLRMQSNKGALTPVSVGIVDAGGNAQILSGLSAGDEVASFGANAAGTQ